MCIPVQQRTSYKWAPASQNLSERTCRWLLVTCWAWMQQETHRDAVSTVPDDTRSQWRRRELHPIHHLYKWHIKVSKDAITIVINRGGLSEVFSKRMQKKGMFCTFIHSKNTLDTYKLYTNITNLLEKKSGGEKRSKMMKCSHSFQNGELTRHCCFPRM